MAEINIDATNGIVGRIGAFAAKQALLGNTVNIFNVEKAIITGKKETTVQKYYQRAFVSKKTFKGPFISRMPDRFVRRMIRGMLPYKKERGMKAWKRIMCYIGVPGEFKSVKLDKVSGVDVGKVPSLEYARIEEICLLLGGERTRGAS